MSLFKFIGQDDNERMIQHEAADGINWWWGGYYFYARPRKYDYKWILPHEPTQNDTILLIIWIAIPCWSRKSHHYMQSSYARQPTIKKFHIKSQCPAIMWAQLLLILFISTRNKVINGIINTTRNNCYSIISCHEQYSFIIIDDTQCLGICRPVGNNAYKKWSMKCHEASGSIFSALRLSMPMTPRVSPPFAQAWRGDLSPRLSTCQYTTIREYMGFAIMRDNILTTRCISGRLEMCWPHFTVVSACFLFQESVKLG